MDNTNYLCITALCLHRGCNQSRQISTQASLLTHSEHIIHCVETKYWSYTILKEKMKVEKCLDAIKNTFGEDSILTTLENQLTKYLECFSEVQKILSQQNNSTQQEFIQLKKLLLECYQNDVEQIVRQIIYSCCENSQNIFQSLLPLINQIYTKEDMTYLLLIHFQKSEILDKIGRKKEAMEYYRIVQRIENAMANNNNTHPTSGGRSFSNVVNNQEVQTN